MKLITSVLLFFIFTNSVRSQNVYALVDHISTEDSLQLTFINKAIPLIEKGYPFDAIRVLKKGLRKSADFYDAHVFLGHLYDAVGKKKKSGYHYGAAIDINPMEPIAYFMRGTMFLKQDLYRAALSDFGQCIRRDPTFYHAYNNMALVRLYNQGGSGNVHINDFKLAAEDFMRLEEETDFVDKDVFFNIGLVQLQLADYRQAIGFFSKTIAEDSAYAKAYFYRGMARFRLREFASAAKDFNQASVLGYKIRESKDYLSFIKIIDKQ